MMSYIHAESRFAMFFDILYLNASDLQSLLSSFLLFFYVYCYAPAYQDKFLVCENLFGNKSDSDSNVIATAQTMGLQQHNKQ